MILVRKLYTKVLCDNIVTHFVNPTTAHNPRSNRFWSGVHLCWHGDVEHLSPTPEFPIINLIKGQKNRIIHKSWESMKHKKRNVGRSTAHCAPAARLLRRCLFWKTITILSALKTTWLLSALLLRMLEPKGASKSCHSLVMQGSDIDNNCPGERPCSRTMQLEDAQGWEKRRSKNQPKK